MKDNDPERWGRMSFSKCRTTAEFDTLFPFETDGKLLPPPAFKVSSLQIRIWRRKTRAEQRDWIAAKKAKDAKAKEVAKRKREEAKAERERKKRADDRDKAQRATDRAAAAAATAAAAAVFVPDHFVSLGDSQEVREKEIERMKKAEEEKQKAPRHKAGKPAATIYQQNDSEVWGRRVLALKAVQSLIRTCTPESKLAEREYPRQRVVLAIVNEVDGPVEVDGGLPSSDTNFVRESPQMFVMSDHHDSVYKIIHLLKDGYPSGGKTHDSFEHLRFFCNSDFAEYLDKEKQKKEKEVFHVRDVPATVNNIVARAAARVRANSI